jgi:hypothetical protein
VKAITLTQPWATAVALGFKNYETRSWSTSYRGPLAIHAAIGFPRWARIFASIEKANGRLPGRVPCGAIVAICEITACFPTWELLPFISPVEKIYGDFADGRFAFKLENVRALSEPLPCKGFRSIWELPSALASTARLLARETEKERPAEELSPAGRS